MNFVFTRRGQSRGKVPGQRGDSQLYAASLARRDTLPSRAEPPAAGSLQLPGSPGGSGAPEAWAQLCQAFPQDPALFKFFPQA